MNALDRGKENAFRQNGLMLFEPSGEPRRLDYSRHVDDCLEFDRSMFGSRRDWREAVVQLSLDVLAAWLVQIQRSAYPLPAFSCVHIEERWLGRGRGAPPSIVLTNERWPRDEESPGDLPAKLVWRGRSRLGEISVGTCSVAKVGRCFRIYPAAKRPRRR